MVPTKPIRPGHVAVREDERDAIEEGIEMERANLHEPQKLIAEQGAGNSVGFFVGGDFGLDECAESPLRGLFARRSRCRDREPGARR